jgi:prevent-host-death family protein
MCYMSEQGESPARVGVRELRQNLSVYLRRVEAGESLDVTEHGRPVARLAPAIEPGLSPHERLLAEGRVSPARVAFVALPPPIELAGEGPSASDILGDMRAEDRGA